MVKVFALVAVVLGAHQSLRGPPLGVGASHPAKHPAPGRRLGALHPELAIDERARQAPGRVAVPVGPIIIIISSGDDT